MDSRGKYIFHMLFGEFNDTQHIYTNEVKNRSNRIDMLCNNLNLDQLLFDHCHRIYQHFHAPDQEKKTSSNENIETEGQLKIDEGAEEEDALLNSDNRSVLTDISNDTNTADLLNEPNK